MKSYRELLTAGQPLNLNVGGRVLYIQRSEQGPVLDVEFVRQNASAQKVERVGKGFKASPTEPFQGIKITASVTGTVDFVITDGDIEIAFDEDETIVGNANDKAIPVRTVPGQPLDVLFGGTVEPVLGVVTVDNTEAEAIPVYTVQAQAVTNVAPSVVTAVASVVLAAAVARKGARLRNVGAEAVAIGGAGVTFAGAVVIIQPGETWNETEAAPAAWWAICDAGLSSTLNIQTIA